MNTGKFSNSTYEDETHIAERELAAFLEAVKKLFGAEQARLAAEDWLDEFDSMSSLPRSTSSDCRAVTIAASARLAKRVSVSQLVAHANEIPDSVRVLVLVPNGEAAIKHSL